MEAITELKKYLLENFKGDFDDSDKILLKYSHDAGLCEVKPKIVIFPKDSDDIKSIVKFVYKNKKKYPELSITVRAAGTCMSGGPLNDSIILDITKYLHGIKEIKADPKNGGYTVVLPGTMYRDFEKETFKYGSILPCYTASKNLNAIGGMIGNNSAGEKTLRYGKMEDYVLEIKIILEDGNEYLIKPLSKKEFNEKISQDDFEGELYRKIWDLISKNQELLEKSKPKVSKNSAGYSLWNIWDKQSFDLIKLIVGSQGTLGIVTEAKLKLVPVKPLSKLFVIFMPNIEKLGDIVNDILPFEPESLESYDDSTMSLAVKFMPSMLKKMKLNFFRLMWSFIPEAFMAITGGMPKLVLLVEFSGDNYGDIDMKIMNLQNKLKHYGFKMRRAKNEFDSEKYWTIRRESFNLLREHTLGRRTAPFIDDVVVPPNVMPEFLPKMRAILDEYNLLYTIAGHAGNGNFHIIPLMDMKDKNNINIIDEVSDKVYDLTISYKGSITGEHNDGIIRTPYLSKMYGNEIIKLFAETKNIFDSKNISNPGKKVGIDKKFMMSHLIKE